MKRNCSGHQSKVIFSINKILPKWGIHWLCTFDLGKLQPYYDDDQEPIMDTDELDSEEDIILVGNANKNEYHDWE